MSDIRMTEMIDGLASRESMEAVAASYETVYRMILESLQNGTAGQAKERLSDFYRMEDRLAETLDVAESDHAELSAQYYFGRLKAAADILSDMADWEKERKEALELSRRFKYLSRCLKLVAERPGIPGKELREHLDVSPSGFSNFMDRVEPYQLFRVYRSGNSKYYYLTPRGRRCLAADEAARSDERRYSEAFVAALLESLAGAVRNGEQNAAEVILSANRRCGSGVLQGGTQAVRDGVAQVLEKSAYRVKTARKAGILASYVRLNDMDIIDSYCPVELPKARVRFLCEEYDDMEIEEAVYERVGK